MKFELTLTTGWIAADPVEIPDEELERLWQQRRTTYAEAGWPVIPDRNEFIRELIYERIEKPLQERLEAVEGIVAIDFQESIIRNAEDMKIL
jgi:hypothetical protein